MRAFFRTKRGVALLVTLLAAVIAAVIAYAYFTASGSGTGTATVGSATNVVLTSDPVSGLSPGQSTPVTIHVHNPGSADEFVGTITGSVEDNGGCLGAWFSVAPVDYNQMVAGNTTGDTSTSIEMIETHTNQDPCQGATVTIDWSTGAGGGSGGGIDLMTDPKNCGQVGNDVSQVPNGTGGCANGFATIASCNAGFADADGIVSDGCEVNLMTDPQNCGQVGTAVPPNGSLNANWGCSNGAIVLASCVAGFADANGIVSDGCEVNLMTDPQNCGQVGNNVSQLPNAIGGCVAGTGVLVACFAGFADADGIVSDGCEVNLLTDPKNCGGVGNVVPPNGTLNANWACSAGAIVLTSCVAGWVNLNGNTADGCEVQADPDPSGNTQATAIDLGSMDCFDATTKTISGFIVSALDNDWYVVHATGGAFCVNDFGSQWSAPGTVAYDVITNVTSVFNLTGPFTSGSSFYSDGSTVLIHVHPTGSFSGSPSYQLLFHL